MSVPSILDALPKSWAAARQAARAKAVAHVTQVANAEVKEQHGVVIKAGFMDKTVTVRLPGQRWNKKLQKFFKNPSNHLCHDPANSLRTGDVVGVVQSWRTSQNKRHVVNRLIHPASIPRWDRPPVPTREERIAARIAAFERKKDVKDAAKVKWWETEGREEWTKKLKSRQEFKRKRFENTDAGRMLLAEWEAQAKEEAEGGGGGKGEEGAQGPLPPAGEAKEGTGSGKPEMKKDDDVKSVD